MSNIIRGNESSQHSEWLVMSNQGTDCFLELLLCAAESLEQTENQRMLISFLKEQKDINETAPGTAGFDISEMPWQKETLSEDRKFLLHVIETAGRKEIMTEMPYDIDRKIVLPRLEQFAGMVQETGKTPGVWEDKNHG